MFEDLDKEERESFLMSPRPRLIQLTKGFQFYRWSATSHIDKTTHQRIRNTIFDQNGFASQYWAPYAAMHEYKVPGFVDIRKRDRNVGGSVGRPRELAREGYAVTREFNDMDSFIKSELLAAAWGFLGKCSPKADTTNRQNRGLPFEGGNYQIVVPGLRKDDIQQL